MAIKIEQRGRVTTTDNINTGTALCHVCKARVKVVGMRPDGKQACQDCYPALRDLITVVEDAR